MPILQIQGELHRIIGRGKADDERAEDNDDEFPPNRGEEFDLLQDGDARRNEEDAHVVDEELADLMNIIDPDQAEEQKKEKQYHADEGTGEGKPEQGKAIGAQFPDEGKGDDEDELLKDFHLTES